MACTGLCAASIVFDLDGKVGANDCAQRNFDKACAAVHSDIGQGFFNDSVDVERRLRAQARRPCR